ncbi:MAG: DUF1573 domain-containing protein [Bacteroidetes bacterium]|nr:DUF1573 domain-containing protein [Bacteroidota bacterium]
MKAVYLIRSLAVFFLLVPFTSHAQVMIAEPAKELGEIYENGGKITTTFTLRNPYPVDTIHILNIETSCGCTAILTQDTLIRPNSTLELEVSYDPSGRLGLFVKSIAVETRTGKSDFSTLYLKISGNVISETALVKPELTQLLDYKVAPIYFYPITAFDTSYLDFSYIISFVNDLTYEIDFYQFTTIGFEIGVSSQKEIETLEYLLNYSRAKLLREFKRRGFFVSTVFFDEPVFKIEEIPVWAAARIKVYSSNFNTEFEEESVVRISGSDFVENIDMALDHQRFNMPDYETLLNEVNFEMLEGKLFMNSRLELRGVILTPANVSDDERQKLKNKLSKLLFKRLKKLTGITKENVSIAFDSLGVHPENKYRFMLWDKDDEQDQQKYRFEVKEDVITPPLLPTFKQSMLTRTTLDTTSQDFKHFWKNLVLNYQAGHAINIVIESSVSQIPRNAGDDNLVIARKRATEISETLSQLFKNETNGGELNFILKPVVQGPGYTPQLKKLVDYAQYEYINLIPTTHANGNDKDLNPQPYQVNFDYYFNGVDTASWLFDKFATYLAAAVEQDGYVELRIESSISKVPVEHDLPNEYLVYSRAYESEKRLRLYLRRKLIDDNRILFTEQRYLVQGPEYDGTIPILQFRKFQYVKIVPQKFLTQE